jgi:FkbM family methyltransferase
MALQIRKKLEEKFLKIVKLYTFNTPIAKGKYRVYLTALKMCKHKPDAVVVSTQDGRKIFADLKTGMHTTVFFLGEYEKIITEIVIELLRNGDVALDVGANFGWYTTVFQKYCGASGEVHAFEPVPPIFQDLERNYDLMQKPKNVFINNLALGDKPDEITINLFAGLSTGHSSLSAQGRDDCISYKTRLITLDSYLEENNVKPVNFVKVDIEGAELMFLKGAEKLFHQEIPPIWLMEMALNQSRHFGHLPNDLINFMRERAAYDFFVIDEITGILNEIESFAPDDIGANVICLPRGFYEDRLVGLNIKREKL